MKDTSSTYTCADAHGEETIEATSGRQAAERWAASYDAGERTFWITVEVWPQGADLRLERELLERHKIAVAPAEPPCDWRPGDWRSNHDWQAAHEAVGGLKSNPGVRGNGGGVIQLEACSRCGRHRVTDTWATDPTDGEQGLVEVRYQPADERSQRWALRQRWGGTAEAIRAALAAALAEPGRRQKPSPIEVEGVERHVEAVTEWALDELREPELEPEIRALAGELAREDWTSYVAAP